MVNPLSNLKLKDWYHIMIVTGLFLFILSITVELVAIDNKVVQLFSLSMFFYGLGEMINHPLQERLLPPSIFTGGVPMIGSGHPRKNSPIGIFFLLIAAILLLVSIYKMIF